MVLQQRIGNWVSFAECHFRSRSGGVWRYLQYSLYPCHVDHWCNAACQQEGWGSSFTQGALEEAGHFPDKPLIISCLVSVVLVLCNITDSGVPAHTLTTIGQFTLPGAMFVLGSAIAKSPILEAFKNWRALIASVARLVVMPLACYFVFGFFIDDQLGSGPLCSSQLCLLHRVALCVSMPMAMLRA